MQNRHINLIAYNNFEKLQNFKSDLNSYRQEKLNSAKEHVDFIRYNFPNKRIAVLELGSGNSKTLYALERENVLKKGYGIEISTSRFDFAELWKKDWNFKNVENINKNILELNFDDFGNIDLCFCVDVAFQFLEPIDKQRTLEILNNIYRSLNVGGKVIIELYDYERILMCLENGNVKLWEEFPPPDPWRFSLCNYIYDHENRFLTMGKIFIKRDEFGFDESTLTLRIYKEDEFKGMLKDIGFKNIEIYYSWDREKYKQKDGEYIVVGEKQ